MSGRGELFTTDLTTDGAIEADDHWPGGDMHVLFAITAGSGTVRVEVTTEDLGAWIPVGASMSSSGHQIIPMAIDVLYRVNVTGSSGLAAHIDILRG